MNRYRIHWGAYLIITALLAIGCDNKNNNDSNVEGITVGDVSNSDCESRTRAEEIMTTPTLKLTREGNNIYGELNNYFVNCAYGDVKVICKEDGQTLKLRVDEGLGDLIANCVCPINIYFTIFNALSDEYQLTLNESQLCTISFKDHDVVMIDLITLDMITDTGLTGKWDLVEVQNGPAGMCKDGYTTRYESGSVIIDLKENGEIVFNYDDGRVETMNYSLPENQEIYFTDVPVMLIGDVPFGYVIEWNYLKLHYLGIHTCDHVPATFVFKRKQ